MPLGTSTTLPAAPPRSMIPFWMPALSATSVSALVEKPFGVFDDAYDEPPFQHSGDDGGFWPEVANLKDESRSLDERHDEPGDAGREGVDDA